MLKAGDIAVLVHGSGARLFEVGEVVLNEVARPKEDGYMVREKRTETWQAPHEVNSNHLVEVEDRDQAIALVTLITYIFTNARDQCRFIEGQRDQSVRNLVDSYRREVA